MSKAVLIIDMPESCDMCDFTKMVNGKMYCGVPGCGKLAEDYIACRPNWCLLKHMAEEKENDYCEWIKYDYRTIVPKNHDVNNPYWRIPENMDKLKYCPYCGREIKVID